MTDDRDKISELFAKTAEAKDSGDAMRFSQAACNAANAMLVMVEVDKGKKQPPAHNKPASADWTEHDGSQEPPVSNHLLVEFIDKDRPDSLRSSLGRYINWVDVERYRLAKKQPEWPQVGDEFWALTGSGIAFSAKWDRGDNCDLYRPGFLGVYPTCEAAEEAALKISKIMNHLRSGRAVALEDVYPSEKIKL